jgi:hypothetical protein
MRHLWFEIGCFVSFRFTLSVALQSDPGCGLSHTLRHLAQGTLAELPAVPRNLILGILLAGAGLNAFWFRLMLIKVLGLGRGKRMSRAKKVN